MRQVCIWEQSLRGLWISKNVENKTYKWIPYPVPLYLWQINITQDIRNLILEVSKFLQNSDFLQLVILIAMDTYLGKCMRIK